MKICKTIIGVAALAVGMALLPPKAEALEILNKNFLSGSNVLNGGSALYTNVNHSSVSNIYMRAGVIVTNNGAFADVTLQKNWDGTACTYSLCGQLVGTNAATTNNVSFVLRGVPLPNGRVSSEATNVFTFAINMNGTNPVTFAQPIPPLTLGQCKSVRVSTITWTLAASAGNTIIERLELMGSQ